MRFVAVLLCLALSLVPLVAAAQEQVWVQIEARPTRSEGEERARAYAGVFPNVAGFAMSTGWYAIVLGPYSRAEADRQLRVLKGERLIPADSYIAFGDRFTGRFWPQGGAAAAPAPAPVPETAAPDSAAAAAPDPALPTTSPQTTLPDETPAEARAAEGLLTGDERRELQSALQWDGFYQGAIDGAFGAGSRRSMAAWQEAMGYEPTGVLTSSQRAGLLDHFRAEQAAIGLQVLTESEAGIEVPYPAALVEFDRYEPPFVHFRERDGSGFRLILISEAGDQTTLAGLYDLMQTLEIVPVEGERQLGRDSFTIAGQNGDLASYSDVRLSGGLIKGFTLVWRPAEAARAARVVEAMKAGFRPLGDRALDEGLGQPLAVDRADLVSGLEVRRPALSRSGFWLDADGLVATTAEAVRGCARVTVGDGHEAAAVLDDAASGLAVLKPGAPLAPRAHALISAAPPRIGADIAIPGFPYEDTLDTAVVTFGTLADSRGLDGEGGRARLTATTRPGDAGAAVLNGAGQVVGMLLPRDGGGTRVLPDDTAVALDAGTLAAALAAAGLLPATAAEAAPGGQLAPEDLTRLGRDLAVIVSCWR
jgi:peptidoglycan hydrolase-like protein with peptidoglycan-binding domain